MPGHWICDRCGYDGEHAEWCVRLRPASEQWMGHRTKEEMEALRKKQEKPDEDNPIRVTTAMGLLAVPPII